MRLVSSNALKRIDLKWKLLLFTHIEITRIYDVYPWLRTKQKRKSKLEPIISQTDILAKWNTLWYTLTLIFLIAFAFIWGCPKNIHSQESCPGRTYCGQEEINFSRFYADIFYGRSLTNIYCCFGFFSFCN